VVVAVDTTLECDGNPDGLSDAELGERAPAPFAPRFWRRLPVERLIAGLAARVAKRGEAGVAETLQVTIAAFADFLGRMPAQAGTPGPARLYFERRPENIDAIPVDMVVDLGNSRTCVLLKEQVEGGRQQRLELVYPDVPQRKPDSCPFLTQSALVEHEIVPRSVAGTVSFRFLSVVKLGNGALEELGRGTLDPRPLGLSTPKRYLWDDQERVDWLWRFANRIGPQGSSPALEGDLVRRIDPANVFGPPPAIPELVQPDHPRVASMVWTIVELLEQSFRQMNSPEWRRSSANAPRADRRRNIASVVLTFPAGLHSLELENFRRAASRACRLWAEFRSSPSSFCGDADMAAGSASIDRQHGVPVPNAQLVCDEGLAIQLCWLYGESVHRFASDAGQLVVGLGRDRPFRNRDGESGHRPTLRLASIDIGGGTVDLAIADYSVREGLPAGVAFRCDRLFHDSISRAGDDIVRSILEELVFPSLIEQIGCGAAAWNRVFATGADGDDAMTTLRRRLVRAAWVPAAMRLLEGIESAAGEGVSVRPWEECTDKEQLRELCQMLAPPGDEGALDRMHSRLADAAVAISAAQMRGVVRRAIGRTIDQCSDIIDQFECDLLVVGGRPSANPEIQEQLYAAMAVPPGQVVFLSELRADDWYPFASGLGRIGDAKTCGVVGGAIAHEARFGMGAFTVEFAASPDPAPIIGFLRHLPRDGAPTFPDTQLLPIGPEGNPVPFLPMQPLVVAARHVDHGEAEARPIYRVSLRRGVRGQLLRNPTVQEPVSVRFDLLPPDDLRSAPSGALPTNECSDRLTLREGSILGSVAFTGPDGTSRVMQADRCVELRLCTLLEADGYWLDTGVFRSIELGGISR
jgi:hypothetical protein